MTSRREVLRMMTALGVSGATSAMPRMARAAKQEASIQLGAQTNAWAIDPKNLDSFFAVLQQIKQIGYAGFETGFFNLMSQFDSPKDAAERIAATGLTFFGIHVFLPPGKLDSATHLPPASLYERVAYGGRALGAQRLIFSSAPFASHESVNIDRKIEALNVAGQFAKGLGMGFAYHNHWWEFQSNAGETAVREIDALYARTDPARVSFLLDAGHAYRGGADVPDFLRKHSSRIVALHLRDYKDGRQVPLGQGSFPLAGVAATLRQLDWKGWAINEEEREDSTKGGLSYIEPAYKALHGAFAE